MRYYIRFYSWRRLLLHQGPGFRRRVWWFIGRVFWMES